MEPILVTGAAGRVGAVGRSVVEDLRGRGLPVRALVRRDDERAEALRATGAEVVVGDLTDVDDVAGALAGCARVYFGMGVSAQYLEAALTTATVARQVGEVEVLVNMSQLTVAELGPAGAGESHQHRQQWLVEQVLAWSGLPVVEIRPTVFLENPLFRAGLSSVAVDGTVRLPLDGARTSPVAAADVAAVVAEVLAEPRPHLGRSYELTGPRALDGPAIAAEVSAALGRPVGFTDVPVDEWIERDLKPLGLPEHTFEHIATMSRLHAENRYDRLADGVRQVTGRPATGIGEYVRRNAALLSGTGPGRRDRG
ncbi:NAD(P)H-binding protein [Kitasatospora sp. NPDC092948]|uniref:NmrA family NAD(P)-binding protein n=1 Tax=Kitasatospora sp. NPDC092948 TaxID=3364088 RepID=UPI0038252B91